jgi:hypothetical protein
MDLADAAVLDMIEGEVLGTRMIEELLAIVDRGEGDGSARWMADRDPLRAEVDGLVASIAAGVDPQTVAPAIKDRTAQIARLEAQLRTPGGSALILISCASPLPAIRPGALRATRLPQMARLILRRLVGPVTL